MEEFWVAEGGGGSGENSEIVVVNTHIFRWMAELKIGQVSFGLIGNKILPCSPCLDPPSSTLGPFFPFRSDGAFGLGRGCGGLKIARIEILALGGRGWIWTWIPFGSWVNLKDCLGE